MDILDLRNRSDWSYCHACGQDIDPDLGKVYYIKYDRRSRRKYNSKLVEIGAQNCIRVFCCENHYNDYLDRLKKECNIILKEYGCINGV
jgi:hypothetical protein